MLDFIKGYTKSVEAKKKSGYMAITPAFNSLSLRLCLGIMSLGKGLVVSRRYKTLISICLFTYFFWL